MTLREKIETLEEGHWLMIVAPRIEHALTGTSRVGVTREGTIKLMYEDGTTEERDGGKFLDTIDADDSSLFALVGYVQDGRK